MGKQGEWLACRLEGGRAWEPWVLLRKDFSALGVCWVMGALSPRLDLLRKGGWCCDQEAWSTFSARRGAWREESLLQPGRERFGHFVAWPMFTLSSVFSDHRAVFDQLCLVLVFWASLCSVGAQAVCSGEGGVRRERGQLHGARPPEHSGKFLSTPEASKLRTRMVFNFLHSIYVYNGLPWRLRW